MWRMTGQYRRRLPRGERGEARGSGRRGRPPGEPRGGAVEADRRGHAPQGRPGRALVVRPARAEGVRALRDRAFDAPAPVAEPMARLGLQPRPDRLVFGARQETEPPAGGVRAARARGAWPAVRRAESGTDARRPRRRVGVLAPGGARAVLRAAHAPVLPVHREVGGVEGVLRPGRPSQVRPRWSDRLSDDIRSWPVASSEDATDGGRRRWSR